MLTEIHKNWNTTVLFSWNYLHYSKKCDLFHWRAYSRWPVFSVCKAIIIQNKQGKPRGVPKADSNFSVWFLKTLTSQNVPIREYTGVTGGEKKLCCLAFTDWWGPPLPFIKVSQFQSMVCINDTLSYRLIKTVFCFFVKHHIKSWDMPKGLLYINITQDSEISADN